MAEEEPDRSNVRNIVSTLSNPTGDNFLLTLEPAQVFTNGFLSKFYMGTFLNKDSGELTYIAIKKVPKGGFITSYNDIYRNEVYFYSTIFPKLDQFQRKKKVKRPFLQIPRYLLGHLDPGNEFLIMENLEPAGYRLYDRTKCLNKEHLELVFKMYGQFHAMSFVYKYEHPEEFENLTSELIDILKWLSKGDMGKSMEEAYRAAINSFDVETEAHIIERLQKVGNVNKILANCRNYKGNYACLIHGDCWISNLLFKYKRSGELEDMKLIDFQIVYASTPVHDLSYFFYSGAPKTELDKLDYYLQVYYDSFSSFVTELGADPQEMYPFEVLKQEWKQYAIMGVIVGIGMWVGKLIEKNEIISLIDREGLSKEKHFEVWNAQMSEVRRGNLFRQRARDICLHAIKSGIL